MVFVLTVLIFVPVLNMYDRYKESQRALYVEQERMDNLLYQKEQVQEDIAYLKSDIGREAEIRSRFSKGKEGERMAFIIEDEASMLTVEEENVGDGAWSGFKEWFLGIFR